MGKLKLIWCTNEKGLSLIEVVASILILSLLLTTFMMMFLQSFKTNKASGEIVDATYIAQTEMEYIYGLSLDTSYTDRKTVIENEENIELGYIEVENNEGKWKVFEKETDNDPVELIRITLKAVEDFEYMDHVIVEVYEMPKKILRSKMQNVIVWEADGP